MGSQLFRKHEYSHQQLATLSKERTTVMSTGERFTSREGKTTREDLRPSTFANIEKGRHKKTSACPLSSMKRREKKRSVRKESWLTNCNHGMYRECKIIFYLFVAEKPSPPTLVPVSSPISRHNTWARYRLETERAP